MGQQDMVLGLDIKPCAYPEEIDVFVVWDSGNFSRAIATADGTQTVPIPGLSIAVPKVGSVGVDALLRAQGNADMLSLAIGIDACGQVHNKEMCGSMLPYLKRVLPVWLF